MSDAHFAIQQGSLGPPLEAILSSNGVVQDLTGATVVFSMRRKETGALKINAAATTIVTPGAGLVRYTWQGTDTDTPGVYFGSFKITGLSPTPAVWPSGGYVWVTVHPKAGA